MENEKPKSIRTIGLLIIIFSGFVVFSNGMGAIAWSTLGMGEGMENPESTDMMSMIFSNYLEMCLTMLSIGIAYLVGGIFVRKYKLWANKLVSILSALIILIIWTLMFAMSNTLGQINQTADFNNGPYINAFFWSVPIVLLIWFLNRKKIKQHFA